MQTIIYWYFLLIIVISLLGFYLGRKYILMRRKEKIRAEELESEFSKQINDSDNEENPDMIELTLNYENKRADEEIDDTFNDGDCFFDICKL